MDISQQLPEGPRLTPCPAEQTPMDAAEALGPGRAIMAAPADGRLRFAVSMTMPCPAREIRAFPLLCAACACRALGGGARLLWPCVITLPDGQEGRVRCRVREGCLTVGFDLPAPDAPERLVSDVAGAVAALAAGYPENRPAMMKDYCALCDTLMKFVDTTYRGVPLYGFAFAVDKDGGLMVMTQESRTVITVYGVEATVTNKKPEQQLPVPPAPRA